MASRPTRIQPKENASFCVDSFHVFLLWCFNPASRLRKALVGSQFPLQDFGEFAAPCCGGWNGARHDGCIQMVREEMSGVGHSETSYMYGVDVKRRGGVGGGNYSSCPPSSPCTVEQFSRIGIFICQVHSLSAEIANAKIAMIQSVSRHEHVHRVTPFPERTNVYSVYRNGSEPSTLPFHALNPPSISPTNLSPPRSSPSSLSFAAASCESFPSRHTT